MKKILEGKSKKEKGKSKKNSKSKKTGFKVIKSTIEMKSLMKVLSSSLFPFTFFLLPLKGFGLGHWNLELGI